MRALLAAGAALLMTTLAGAATPPAQFEVRLIVPCQPGDATYILTGGIEEFCLAKDVLFDGTAVVKVERYPMVPKAVMVITDAASDKLYDFSFDKQDERVGFLFNGKLIFAPVIDGPVKTKELQITLKNDPDDIDALVAAFPGAAAAQ